ncbi:TfoX/Sxy family protein [Pedobacter polaris]|uniref:TfoX/Sxy family protein n=1 Tax=Pedobacter polaris TaxID=2571273 RepID=A0A4U1CXL6_9SPHI|nr:TfoX/Sxy family protein [Pedobacter polaris]TKC12189.1 TfoX/Sxy family protein [Pedobacter polaris]
MLYNEELANRVRTQLAHLRRVEEKQMFSGLVFMVDGKMCIGVSASELMVRMNPDSVDEIADLDGWRQMIHGKKPMKGYVFVSEDVLVKNEDLKFWIDLALTFNPLAKSSKNKTS